MLDIKRAKFHSGIVSPWGSSFGNLSGRFIGVVDVPQLILGL